MGNVTTQKEVGEMLTYIVDHMATKQDLVEMRHEITGEMTSLKKELKGDILSLRLQVNSIESQIRGMKHDRLEVRVADLEEKVFGKAR